MPVFGREMDPIHTVVIAILLIDRSVGAGNHDTIGARIRNLSNFQSLSNLQFQGFKFIDVALRAVFGSRELVPSSFMMVIINLSILRENHRYHGQARTDSAKMLAMYYTLSVVHCFLGCPRALRLVAWRCDVDVGFFSL